jgi:hypothetical protein
MLKADFRTYIDQESVLLTEKINDSKHSANDEVSAGKLQFYLALLEFMDGKPSNKARGLVGAVNDTLQKLQVLDSKQTLPSLINELQ